MDRDNPLRERELERRRRNEQADLEVERTIGPRPLEGLSQAPGTLWPEEQNDREAPGAHGDDEARARAASESQLPPEPR